MPKLLETVGTDQVITLNCNDPTIKGFFAIPFINLDLTGMASEYLVRHHQVKDAVVVTPDAHKDGIRNATDPRLQRGVVPDPGGNALTD